MAANPHQPCPLLDLPPELRIRIYEYLAQTVSQATFLDADCLPIHPVAEVSWQLRHEFAPVYEVIAVQCAEQFTFVTTNFGIADIVNVFDRLTPRPPPNEAKAQACDEYPDQYSDQGSDKYPKEDPVKPERTRCCHVVMYLDNQCNVNLHDRRTLIYESLAKHNHESHDVFSCFTYEVCWDPRVFEVHRAHEALGAIKSVSPHFYPLIYAFSFAFERYRSSGSHLGQIQDEGVHNRWAKRDRIRGSFRGKMNGRGRGGRSRCWYQYRSLSWLVNPDW
jgi:hypothetical protein